MERNKPNSISIFTDRSLDEVKHTSSRVNVAWLLESPAVHADIYSRFNSWSFRRKFDYILTFDRRLLEKTRKANFYALGGCWIRQKDRRVHEKSKDCSIIASAKRDLQGQLLRHQIIDAFKDGLDVFGSGYSPLANKIDGLAKYRYSIVVENCRSDYYFTEKLIDCLVTGTIPIYWGCPSIEKFFNPKGILAFENLDDLKNLLELATPEYYENQIHAVKENFEAALAFTIPEDYIYSHFLKPKLGL